MPDIIRKQISNVVKTVEGKERVLEFIGTTETKDRDDEIIKADAWQVDRYLKNPVVQWAHRYGDPPVGKTVNIRREGTNTIFAIEFADKDTYPFADTVFRLCKGGFLSATSVGFIPIESEKGKTEGRIYTKAELLEISIVPVPSNPDALVTARDAGVISVKEFDGMRTESTTEIKHAEVNRTLTQAHIRDEMDYLASMIDKVGLAAETKAFAAGLIKRITGGDMPAEIKSTADMVVPVLKMMDEHHGNHNRWYEGCRKALMSMCEEEDKKQVNLREILAQELKRQLEV